MLIAVGLARPALSSLATLWGGGRTAAVAIVLDNSASMAVVDGGRPRFETARQSELPAGPVISISRAQRCLKRQGPETTELA